jgi:hypothetical protein
MQENNTSKNRPTKIVDVMVHKPNMTQYTSLHIEPNNPV